MSELITRTARLVPYVKRPKQVPSFVTAYSYEPLADDPGSDLGNLYVVMEVLVSGRASEEVADLVIETIGERYYNNAAHGAPALERFEASIKAANHELSEHVNRGNASWIGKLSAVIAIQVAGELHVAQTGSAEAYLYRGKSASHISASGPNRPTTPSKTFGSIATGQLEPGDRILLATPALIHQVPLVRLQNIISQSGPNAAIAEITELLRGTSIDRIAGLVIELTTPELAALQVRSEQPSEIRLGSPENALEAARMAAAPIAKSTVSSGKKVAHAAHTGIKRARPHAKAAGLIVADALRQILSTAKGRKITVAVIFAVLLTILLLIFAHGSSAKASVLFNKYQAAYGAFTHAQELLDSGQKADARIAFEGVDRTLDTLKPGHSTIDAKLAHMALPENEPRSFAALQSLSSDRIDQIDGLIKTKSVTVVNFSAKNSRVDHFELVGEQAYVFDSGNAGNISIVNVLTGTVKTSNADTKNLGDIVATTPSGAGDGIFILTSQPAVWLYRFDNDTVTKQQISFGSWPKSKAIASYGSNLYLLGDDLVYKHVKTSSGYSPKTAYLATGSGQAQGASALAVDGFVYLLSPSGLHRYLSGAPELSAAPSSLGTIVNLRSTSGGNVIIGTNPVTHRVGMWNARSNSLSFAKQVEIADINKLYDATYDSKSGNVYALANGRLIRFPVQP